MALFTETTIRKRAAVELLKDGILKKAQEIIKESSALYYTTKSYDIFLSHSIRDANLILGMKGTLEDLGYSVYVDWIDDPQMDRSKVTAQTADKLRQRMDSSSSLFYITTTNTDSSKWMPWECGYFDGHKEKVAIIPIEKQSSSNNFIGQEYLGLYPYAVQARSSKNVEMLWIHKSNTQYVAYDDWVKIPNSQIAWKT